MKSIAEVIKEVVAVAELAEGEVKHKVLQAPSIKPPRRKLKIENKSNKSDYMKNYMTEYRGDGKDYQKMPDAVKEFRKDQKKNINVKIEK